MKKNKGSVLGSILLMIWAIALLKIWSVGDLPKLVNPKYIPFILVSAGLSVVMSIVLLFRRAGDGHPLLMRSSLFLVPAVVALFMRPAVLTGSDTLQRTGISSPAFSADSVYGMRNTEIIAPDGSSYYPVISDMYENPHEYAGKNIRITGMVLVSKSDEDKADFAVARMIMLCCAADVSPVGIPCHWGQASSLGHRSWYTVTGTIGVKKLEGSDVPFVDVDGAVPAEKPSQEYFYPF